MRYVSKLAMSWGLLTFLALPLFGSDISADFSKVTVKIKPEAIRGQNVNNSMQIAMIKKKVNLMKIPDIEYPAGNIGDQIDQHPTDLNSLNFFHLQQSMLLTPFTFMQIRLYKGSIDEALQAIDNAKTNKVRVDVWNIGNEPDRYSVFGAAEWTADKYNSAFREYLTAMKKADPAAKFAGPLVSQPKDDWVLSFIKEDGDIVDVLDWHWYPTDGNWQPADAIATAGDITNQIVRYRGWLKDPAANPKGYKRDIKLALGEYAVSWNTPNPNLLTDMTGAIWTAEVMGYMAMYEIDYSTFFCLGALGANAVFEDKTLAARPVYWVFLFYANHFGDEMVNSASSDGSVKVFASKDSTDNTGHILIINEDLANDKDISISVDGMEAKSVKGYVLADDSKGLELDAKKISIKGKKITVNIPAKSVTALDID